MILLNDTIYLSLAELETYGISQVYARKAMSVSDGPAWKSIRDPRDSRRALVDYDSIPDGSRGKLPSRDMCLALARTGAILDLLPDLSEADDATLRGYRIMREETDPVTGEVYEVSEGGLPAEKRAYYAMQCRWLALLASIDNRYAKRQGYKNRRAMIEAMMPVMRKQKTGLPTSYRGLTNKVKEYETEGAKAVIPGYYGMRNAEKIGEDQLFVIVGLYGDPKKPTAKQVWQHYNGIAMARQWPVVKSVRTVERQLYRPDVMPVWFMGREGFEAWKNRYAYSMTTMRPSARNLLWVSDGTKVNYYYQAGRGKAARLWVYAVMDVYSGYFVGVEITDEEENAAMIRDAVRKACQHTGELPYQFLYDGDAANTAFFAKSWAGLHFPAQPYNGQSKAIERVFGQLQQYIMRRNLFFTGQNILSQGHTRRSRVNIEAVEAMMKRGELPTKEQAIKEAYLDFEIWNETPQRVLGGKSPRQAYEESQCPQPRPLTPALEQDIFWEWNKQGDRFLSNTYTNSGIQMTHNGRTYLYEVVDEDGLPDLGWMLRHTGQEFYLRYDPWDPGARVQLYAGEDRRYMADAVSRDLMKRSAYDQEPGDRGKIADRLQLKRDQAQTTEARIAALRSELDAEDIIAAGPRYIPKPILERAQAYLVGDDSALEDEPKIDVPPAQDLTDKKLEYYRKLMANNED